MSQSTAEQAITSFSLSPESATSQFGHFTLSFFFFLLFSSVFHRLPLSLFILFPRRRAIHSHVYGLLSVFEMHAYVSPRLLTCCTASRQSSASIFQTYWIFGLLVLFIGFISNCQTIHFTCAHFTFFCEHRGVLVIWKR